jgi:hypothetical protein
MREQQVKANPLADAKLRNNTVAVTTVTERRPASPIY